MNPLKHFSTLWKVRMLLRHPIRTFRLFADRETPLFSKILLGAGVLYLLSPLDIVPDLLVFFGLFDDVAVVILLLAYALSRIPDAAYERVGLDRTVANLE